MRSKDQLQTHTIRQLVMTEQQLTGTCDVTNVTPSIHFEDSGVATENSKPKKFRPLWIVFGHFLTRNTYLGQIAERHLQTYPNFANSPVSSPKVSPDHTCQATHLPPLTLHAAELTVSKPTWWLESRFHFSFANTMYQDPKRNNFGALRVINDDLVKGRAGFG